MQLFGHPALTGQGETPAMITIMVATKIPLRSNRSFVIFPSSSHSRCYCLKSESRQLAASRYRQPFNPRELPIRDEKSTSCFDLTTSNRLQLAGHAND
jgi:hypothetical protein